MDRSDTKPPDHPDRVVLFDGVCNLCNGFVQFIIRRDPDARFRFAALQSQAAANLLPEPPPVHNDPESVLYLRHGRLLDRSTAALYILKDLGGAWKLTSVFLVVPRAIRDAVYRWVARNRYRWFGRKDACMVPTPDLQARFL